MNSGAAISQVADTHPPFEGIWRLADPKISLASISSMFVGACAAAAAAPLNWGWLIATVLGILAIEVAKNASGEVVDFKSGADLRVRPEDRTPFSGGKRVLVDQLMTVRQTTWVAGICYATGITVGVIIAAFRAPQVYCIGVAGVLLAWQYHASPLKLSYRGLGEVAVALCYGPLIAMGTYVVQVQTLSLPVVLSALPLGILIAAFLWINEFPDYRADAASGKKTLVVRMGRKRAANAYAALNLLAFFGISLLPLATITPWTMLALLGGIPASMGIHRVLNAPESTANIIPAQKLALITFASVAFLQGLGFLIATF